MKREVEEAKLARTLQSRFGNMCDAKLKQMVSVNGLKNAPIRPEHVTNATRIFGPNTAGLEGKTVRRPSPRVHEDGQFGKSTNETSTNETKIPLGTPSQVAKRHSSETFKRLSCAVFSLRGLPPFFFFMTRELVLSVQNLSPHGISTIKFESRLLPLSPS